MSNMEAAISALIENQEANGKKLDKVVTILEGNGDPRNGLVVRFDRVEQQFLTDRREKSRIKMLLVGAIIGFAANAGLFVAQLVQG